MMNTDQKLSLERSPTVTPVSEARGLNVSTDSSSKTIPVTSKKFRLFGVDLTLPDEADEIICEASKNGTTLTNNAAGNHHGDNQHVHVQIGDSNQQNMKRKSGEYLHNAAESSDKHIHHNVKLKGIKWSDREHQQFLRGLQEVGKGNWKVIAKKFVPTRTPVQVASHAQKYFKRITASFDKKRKKRLSIFDAPLGKPTVDRESPVHDSPVPLQRIGSESPPMPKMTEKSQGEVLHHHQRNLVFSRFPRQTWPHRPVLICVPNRGYRRLAQPFGSWQAYSQLQQPSSVATYSSEFREAQSNDDLTEGSSQSSPSKLPIEVV